jgi:very-short-patch-repair endonuclease
MPQKRSVGQLPHPASRADPALSLPAQPAYFCQNEPVADGIDFVLLRRLAKGSAGLSGYSHDKLGQACADLGLSEPPRRDEGRPEPVLTKQQRIEWSFAALADGDLPAVAGRILAAGPPNAADRNALQDALWAGRNSVEVPRRTRREIARSLDLGEVTLKPERFMALLDSLWVLGTGLDFDPWAGDDPQYWSLRRQIDQWVIRNRDWTAEDLFDALGAIDEASDMRFALFLEGLASSGVVPDEPAQRRVAAAVNRHLHPAGAELRETGADGGYPVFSIVSTRAGRARQPKNVIFASRAKPDIRFRDAIDNDIEIVGNADDVLVYDRPIAAGILWGDLLAWWKDQEGSDADDDQTSSALYRRLRSILPENSPAQQNLFYLYHSIYRDILPGLPALLPEVWLLWDPKAARLRGPDALLKHRMDFLLLLPRGERIVLEVDGQTHYATNGRPDPRQYADGVRADRELKLAGYEVYRFGATELQDPDTARTLVSQFFTDLFQHYGVSPL